MKIDSDTDVRHMRSALELAKGGIGWVSPNPLVGCVLAKDGEVVGRGYHQRFGGPHAEVHALREAGDRARGAVLYVTLEPCCHTGKTPPCVDAILRAQVGRLVVAMRDPNPRVDGGGLSRLRSAGIEVTVGVCEAEARRLNEAFVKYITTRRPFVTSKSAITLDGKIATRSGASRWITGEAARATGHQLRHASDAILVGIGTVLQDDPQLTTRLPGQRGANPLRIVVDSTLRLPPEARVADVAQDRRSLVATTEQAAGTTARALRERGVEVVGLPACGDGRVNLDALCKVLGERGVASVLVEGGAVLTAALLRQRLIDKMVFFVAPKIIGGDGVSVFGPCGVDTMEQALSLRNLASRPVGDDVMLEAYSGWTACSPEADWKEGSTR
jgi:diaminohydroxyphosphoribosylaminopyrimidine deaminase/5-amino-6-(5-phosphoribosylamino)uracil reductase